MRHGPQPALRLSSTKRLIVLTGRPGTGKTVVGVELLRRAWRERWNARYSSPSTSFNENMRRCFGSGDARATALFTSVRKLAPFADRPLDLLIVDEAHRLPTYPWTQRTKAALREQRLPTVQEVLKASHTIVCFIDESQRVRPKETLTVDELAALAEAEGFDVVHYTLAKTFRAGGEPGYDDWVRALLGMDEGGTELQPGEVRYPERKGAPFDVVTTASAADLEKLIRAKDNPQDPGAGGRARLTAGFAWKWESYKKVTKLPPDVRDGDWAMPGMREKNNGSMESTFLRTRYGPPNRKASGRSDVSTPLRDSNLGG